jgi:hypothetical protein
MLFALNNISPFVVNSPLFDYCFLPDFYGDESIDVIACVSGDLTISSSKYSF